MLFGVIWRSEVKATLFFIKNSIIERRERIYFVTYQHIRIDRASHNMKLIAVVTGSDIVVYRHSAVVTSFPRKIEADLKNIAEIDA